jgi:hypothetical protein
MSDQQPSDQTQKRFQPRTQPYNIQKDGRLIRNAHRRRHDSFKDALDKMDRNHPSAYGLTIISPELGFNRYNLSGLLTGFEETPFFNQFIADMTTYISARTGNHRFTTQDRLTSSNDSVSDLISKYASSSHTRDALRTFFTSLATEEEYEPLWKASHLTLDIMKNELLVVAGLPKLGSDPMWKAVVRTNAKIKSHQDLLYIVQLVDAIARQKNEPLLPKYPFEQDNTAPPPPTHPTAVSITQTPSSTDSNSQTVSTASSDLDIVMGTQDVTHEDTAAQSSSKTSLTAIANECAAENQVETPVT